MRSLSPPVLAFLKNEDGPTSVEYAIMMALVIVVCVASVTALGTNSSKAFGKASDAMTNSGSGSGS